MTRGETRICAVRGGQKNLPLSTSQKVLSSSSNKSMTDGICAGNHSIYKNARLKINAAQFRTI